MFSCIGLDEIPTKIIANKYSKVVLLTQQDKRLWGNKSNLRADPNPVSFTSDKTALLNNKQIIAAGRPITQKGFDLLD